MKKLSEQLAIEFGLEPEMIQAVMEVESSGSGFFTDWEGEQRIKIQFEPHWFVRLLNRKDRDAHYTRGKRGSYKVYVDGEFILENRVERQLEEWDAFIKACAVNFEIAHLSTSWGLGQVMGFNFKVAGFDSVMDMVDAFELNELEQARGMMNFISGNNLLRHLKSKRYDLFARGYNGKGYKMYNYDVRIKKAYERLKKNGTYGKSL
ncbi:hypothetical protein LCGC14_0370480 [marine sediment metagenome]|uniref:N-acetylmuramidase domain-containing protein n=1 Tax=marine sediment metagenome TaxID=412755 RepID=A0A0F9TN59_9ZZZZ|nr:N-acetylmuramidase family protein [Maribacter sp.]HDZ04883.1 N-acetylmuramidase family protein [Maribacter sp.]